MKFKTTNKALKEGYGKIVKVGYCDLQYLLNYHSPVAYTCGVYGWNANIYEVNGVAICTGYRPIGNIKPDYNLIREYNQKAKDVLFSGTKSDDARKKLDELLEEFLEKVLEKRGGRIWD